MSYRIRPYRDGDAEALSALLLAAIRQVGSHAYSDAQTKAWAARHQGPDRMRERVAKCDRVLVAADDNDMAVAYALLEDDGHLDHLYCHPEHTRRGLADKLLSEAETLARSIGCERLFTEASELARPAFERAGYSVTHRRDFIIEHDGKDVPIHNYAMEKTLT